MFSLLSCESRGGRLKSDESCSFHILSRLAPLQLSRAALQLRSLLVSPLPPSAAARLHIVVSPASTVVSRSHLLQQLHRLVRLRHHHFESVADAELGAERHLAKQYAELGERQLPAETWIAAAVAVSHRSSR